MIASKPHTFDCMGFRVLGLRLRVFRFRGVGI